MSYTQKTWECGDVITAEALNNIEGGVAQALECCGSGGFLLIRESDLIIPSVNGVLRTTIYTGKGEISDCYLYDVGDYAGEPVVLLDETGGIVTYTLQSTVMMGMMPPSTQEEVQSGNIIALRENTIMVNLPTSGLNLLPTNTEFYLTVLK